MCIPVVTGGSVKTQSCNVNPLVLNSTTNQQQQASDLAEPFRCGRVCIDSVELGQL